MGSNSYLAKSYYIKSIDHLEKNMDEIISICDFHQARAYINLNVRSFEKIAFHLMKKISDILMNKDWKSCRNAYDSVCGTYGTGKNKLWVVDVDDITSIDSNIPMLLRSLINETGQEPTIIKIPTLNGYHYITNPFDSSKFLKVYPNIDIHKNNPTILYCY